MNNKNILEMSDKELKIHVTERTLSQFKRELEEALKYSEIIEEEAKLYESLNRTDTPFYKEELPEWKRHNEFKISYYKHMVEKQEKELKRMKSAV